MNNIRGRNFLYKNYIFGIQKNLNDMFSELRRLNSTCSISADFIKQFLIYQNIAEKVSKNISFCTNFRSVCGIASEISENRDEIIKDIKKIEHFCGNFKNCNTGIRNYKNEFNKICDDYCNVLKHIVNSGNNFNINIFFLKFMIRYNNFSVLLIQNALKYRICPQLRLISEYCTVMSRKENIKMKDILNSIK